MCLQIVATQCNVHADHKTAWVEQSGDVLEHVPGNVGRSICQNVRYC